MAHFIFSSAFHVTAHLLSIVRWQEMNTCTLCTDEERSKFTSVSALMTGELRNYALALLWKMNGTACKFFADQECTACASPLQLCRFLHWAGLSQVVHNQVHVCQRWAVPRSSSCCTLCRAVHNQVHAFHPVTWQAALCFGSMVYTTVPALICIHAMTA